MACWIVGVLALGGAAGCFLSQQDDTSSSPDEVVSAGDVSQVLKSTLVLKGGCVATKIGPKHLLTAARCVVGNPAYQVGSVVSYKVASAGGQTIAPPSATDAGYGDDQGDDGGSADEAGAPADGDASAPNDAGPATDAGSTLPTIASVQIHPSFTQKCKAGTCNLDAIDATDAPDVAVIVLANELATVPTVPVDLDEVGEGDPLLVVGSGCGSAVDATGAKVLTAKTAAVPASDVAHKGGPYAASPQLAARVAASYVVTPGAGWKGVSGSKVCIGDLGAPAFRQNAAAVTGLFSNYTARTTALKTPVTIEHTRVDQMSRFKVGAWLDSLGATTIHSCSESANGCPKNAWSGGTPDDGPSGESSDAGKGGDAMAPPGDPSAGGTVTNPLPDDSDSTEGDPSTDSPDYADAAVAPIKKSSAKSGCSAAPGNAGGSGALVLGVGLAMAAMRRRRK